MCVCVWGVVKVVFSLFVMVPSYITVNLSPDGHEGSKEEN